MAAEEAALVVAVAMDIVEEAMFMELMLLMLKAVWGLLAFVDSDL